MSGGTTEPTLADEAPQGVPEPILVPVPIDPSRPMWSRVLVLAWPVFVQQSLVLVVNIYDMFLAGTNTPADPSNHVAYQDAHTTAIYLSWFASTLAYLVSVGATALVARFVGGGERDLAVRVTHQALLLAVVVGTAFSLLGLAVLPEVVWLLGQRGESADMSVRFLEPIFWLLMFQVVETAGLACLVGAGDTRMTLYVLGGVAVVNVPLSWALLHGYGPIPEVGFPGITMGTALAHAFGGVAVVVALALGRAGLRLRLSMFVPAWGLTRRLLRVSVPAFFDSFSLTCFQLWFLALVNGLGEASAAAHGIAIRIEAMGYLSGMAFGTAAAALVGQNLGAAQPHEAARGGWMAFLIGCGVMSFMGVVFFTFAPGFYELFCPYEHQRPIIEQGVPVLRLVAFAMPPLAAGIVLTQALRGAGDSRWPAVFTWVGFLLVRIPLAYLLIPYYGLYGAWMAMVIDLYLRGALVLWRFTSGRWQLVRV